MVLTVVTNVGVKLVLKGLNPSDELRPSPDKMERDPLHRGNSFIR